MNEQSGFIKFSSSEELLPQEEMLEIRNKNKTITIGLPKETNDYENRVCLVPGAVELLVQNGHRIIVESDAGLVSRFKDLEYSEAGADVVQHAEEVYKADIILKVNPLSRNELKMVKTRQLIISALCIANQERKYFKELIARKATAIAFEKIQDKSGAFPVLRSMSKIVGNMAILIAADYLCNPEYGKGKMLGGFPGIKPTEIVIIGAGTIAENAARAALGMGAIVKVFDNSIYKLERLQNTLNNKIFTSIIQPRFLVKELKNADIVIGSAYSEQGIVPCIVTEDMVKKMKEGSIIIDVSIDQGGCFETSRATNHKYPVYKVHGVSHYCVPNIAARVPNTASYALSNFFTPALLKVGELGGFETFFKSHKGFCKGVYMLNGTITNKLVGDMFNLPYKEISLLMAALE
jgi:alanine dehydrogenase